jgi:hypothetical protein
MSRIRSVHEGAKLAYLAVFGQKQLGINNLCDIRHIQEKAKPGK